MHVVCLIQPGFYLLGRWNKKFDNHIIRQTLGLSSEINDHHRIFPIQLPYLLNCPNISFKVKILVKREEFISSLAHV